MSIGKRIKERRKALGMSADKLAEQLGKDRSTVYRYEKGDIENLPLDILEPIAAALNTTPQHLMGWDETEEKPSAIDKYLAAEEAEWLEIFRSAPERSRPLLLETFRTFKKIPLELQPEALNMLQFALRMQKKP